MNLDQLTSLAASGGQLALGLSVIRRRSRSAVALPLGLTTMQLARHAFAEREDQGGRVDVVIGCPSQGPD